ncbi:MAG: flagellar basal body-associated FliL family protein [Firmicutes bacterium]|nr:flagellar basal body-associated FliL family protein [Bacillota bacterium]
MKKIVGYILAFVLGLAGGAAGLIFGDPSLLSHTPAPVIQAVPYNSQKAVPIAESNVESNLSSSGHYVRFDLEFSVMPQALTAAGVPASSSSSGSGSGTTLPAALNAKVLNALTNLARSTSYQQLESSGGVATFKAETTEVLESIFGPNSVGNVYFSTFLTQ